MNNGALNMVSDSKDMDIKWTQSRLQQEISQLKSLLNRAVQKGKDSKSRLARGLLERIIKHHETRLAAMCASRQGGVGIID